MADTLAHLQVHSTVIPEYFYDFPEGAKRSVEGSVHFRPGTVFLTEDELQHIESAPQFGHLKGKYTVISRPGAAKPQEGIEAQDAPVAVASPDQPALESSGQRLHDATTPIGQADPRSKYRK